MRCPPRGAASILWRERPVRQFARQRRRLQVKAGRGPWTPSVRARRPAGLERCDTVQGGPLRGLWQPVYGSEQWLK